MECFVIYSNEIEGRLDPSYYHPSFAAYVKQSNKLITKKLIEISPSLKNGSTPSGGKFEQEGIPYFRSQDFDLYDFYIQQYITKDFHKKLSRSSIKPGDVLVAVVGATLGKIGYVPTKIEDANINQNVARIRVEDKNINSEYLAIFLSSQIGQKLIYQNATVTTQAYLNNEQLGNIQILLPPLEVQNEIVAQMQSAYKQKKEKEQKAEQLLNSIDDYVLKELGIKLPELKNEMCFVVNSEEVKGKRVDAFYNQPYFKEIEKSIESGKFETKIFGTITDKIINGLDSREYKEEGKRYLRVGNIKPYRIDLEDVKFVDEKLVAKDISLNVGDLLITRKGSFGIAAVVKETDLDYLISSEIFRITFKEKVNTDYLCYWINSKACQIIFNRIKTGAIMGHLTQDVLAEIKIPFPPINIQTQIASEVKSRMREAVQLKQEAKNKIEETKKEVEKMILG